MKKVRPVVFLCLSAAGMPWSGHALAAGNEVYVCTDSNGTRTYQNTGPSEQCRRMNLDPVLSVPVPKAGRAPVYPSGAPAPSPAPIGTGRPEGSASSGNPQGGGTSSSGSSQPATGGAASPSGAWAREAQQARESDRLKILEAEYREEERRLATLQQRQQTAPDERIAQDIARAQASLESLRREMGKVRRP